MSLPPVPDSSYVKHFDGMLWMAYTPKDMKAYGQACREQALEDAAQVCDVHADGDNDATFCAKRIRSFK